MSIILVGSEELWNSVGQGYFLTQFFNGKDEMSSLYACLAVVTDLKKAFYKRSIV